MNLEYPLNDSYYAYSHIEIIKLKEKGVVAELFRKPLSLALTLHRINMQH